MLTFLEIKDRLVEITHSGSW